VTAVHHDGSLAESDVKPHVHGDKPVKPHGVKPVKPHGVKPQEDNDVVRTPFSSSNGTAFFDHDDLPFTVDWHEVEVIKNKVLAMSKKGQDQKLRKAQDGSKHVFLHIHKNAGTFLCKLAQRMGVERIHPDAATRNCNLHFDDYHTEPGAARSKSCDARNDILKQSGATYTHVEQPAYPSNAKCPDTTYVVTLRDPVARICSHSRMGEDDSFDTMFLMGGAAYLKDKINQGAKAGIGWRQAWQFLDNYQVRVLAPAFDVPAGKITEKHVAQAKATLNNMHVGVLEDYTKTAKTISSAFGWPDFTGSMRAQHTYPSCMNQRFGDEADLDELRKLNKWDVQLVESFK
jgi:hypothetical protein